MIAASHICVVDNVVMSTCSVQLTWLACSRSEPPAEPFTSADSFDLYIDGCRHLPDVVTVSRVRLKSTILLQLICILPCEAVNCAVQIVLMIGLYQYRMGTLLFGRKRIIGAVNWPDTNRIRIFPAM